MTIHLGYVPASSTLYIPFTSYNSSGASVTLTGLAATDIEIYKNGSTTQRASDNGYTLLDTDGIDFDGVTGLHGFSIDLSDNSDSGFYAAGSFYWVVVSTVTIDSQTVTLLAATFFIGPGPADLINIAGSAVSTSTAQLGVNVVNAAGTAWNSGAIGASTLATDTLTAAKIAADAIGASELAADAVAEIADGVWDEVLTGATHNVASSAGRRLRSLQDNGVYALAAVWVDETAGSSSGTTSYEDATVTNRADDFDNAVTVAAAVGLDRIHIQQGNSITLTATLNGYQIIGDAYTLALGGQDIGSSIFQKFGVVTGIGTGTTPIFDTGLIGTVTLPPCVLFDAGFAGTFTAGSAGDFAIINCHSQIAGASAPTFDFSGTGSTTTASFRRWSGGMNLTVDSDCTISVDAVSGGTVTISGTGGTVHVRGMVAVTDSSGGSVTIVKTQAISTPAINAEVLDVLNVDTYSEPATGAPTATPTIRQMAHYLYKAWRNKFEQTEDTYTLYADDGSTADQAATVSDDGTTFTRGEIGSG